MPNLGITNLTAGEVSPILMGRADTSKFANACERLENFLITVTGMWSYRPGMCLMGQPKNQDKTARLWPFQFSDQQGFILELGDLYMRVWYTTGQVVNGSTAVEVATPFPLADLSLLGFAQSADYLFVVDENVGICTIKRAGSNILWQVGTFALSDGPYGAENGDGTKVLALSSNAGVVTVTSSGFSPDTSGGQPFKAGDEGRLIRVYDGTDASGNEVWRWLIVTNVISTTQCTATFQNGPATTWGTGGTSLSRWRLGIYSNRLGWPSNCRIFQQRLLLAGAASAPDRIDGSAIAGYSDFAPRDPLTADGAWGFTLGTENVNRIVGLGISNDLVVMTQGAEHRMNGDSSGSAITPSQVWQMPIAPDGAARTPPVNAHTAIAFIDKYRLNIRAISFDWRFQNYSSDNLTLLADHMAWLDPASPGFQALVWQGNPFGTLWTIRGNGELAGCIYEPIQQVLGWHRHPMGSAAGETPVVESIAILKGPTHDELWALVRRELPGRTLRTIERMGRPGLWDTPPESLSFLDSSLSLANTPTADLVAAAATGQNVTFTAENVTNGFIFRPTDVGRFIKQRYLAGYSVHGRPIYETAIAQITTYQSATQVQANIVSAFPSTEAMVAGSWGFTVSEVTGLDHLEGCLVTAVSDGRVCAPKAVKDGTLQLDVPGWEIHAGLQYEGWMVSMPLDPGPQAVVGQTRYTRTENIMARILNSLGGEFASVPETDEEPLRWESILPYRQRDAAPQASPRPQSGDKQIKTAGEWTRRAQIAVRQTQPLPLNVQLMIPHVYAPHVQP